MTKKSSKKRFIILSILVAIGILLSVVTVNIPFTNTTYNGFIKAIPLGIDLQGGTSYVFEASLPKDDMESDLNTALSATVARIENLLSSKNVIGGNVIKQGGNKIKVEVPNATNADQILKIIGQPANLKITKTESKDAEAVMTGKHIQNAVADYQDIDGNGQKEHCVRLSFTKEGTKLFAELTKEISKSGDTIYIYVGDDDQPLTRLTSTGAITNGVTYISGENLNSEKSAGEFALKILSGSFNTELSLLESSTINPILGEKALLFCAIAMCVIFALILVLLPIIFGDFGFIADFAFIIFAIIYLFLLQSVPTVQLTIAGFAGLLLSMILLTICFAVTYVKISQEYKLGKKLHMAVKSGLNKALNPVIDLNVIFAVSSLALFLFSNGVLKSFALVLLLGTIVSAFVSLWVIRRLLIIYLPLNSTNSKKLKLKREAGVDEIK